MDLHFAGAETPTYLRQLIELDVTHVAISFFEWRRRHSTDVLYKHVPEEMSVIVVPGVAKKKETEIDFKAFGEDYIEFAEKNAEHALIFDLDAPHCPQGVRRDVRNHLSILPNVVMFPMEDETHADLAQQYERIGVNASAAKSIPTNELRRLQASLYGSNITDPKVLQIGRFVATTSFAWLSGRRYGELWVFARGRLRHYQADSLAKAVRAHSGEIEALGVDPLAALANDPIALTVLAVRSLQRMAENLSKRPRDRQEADTAAVSGNGAAAGSQALVLSGGDASSPSSGSNPPVERARNVLPIISMKNEAGQDKLSLISSSLRQCNDCYLSSTCPKFEENHSCAYNVPVTIKTEADWLAVNQVLLEIQFQRISFGYFAEQVEGGAITARLGQEMDRYFKMLKDVRDIETTPPPDGGGALSRAFGGFNPPTTEETDGPEEETDEDDSIEEVEVIDIDFFHSSNEQRAGDGFADESQDATI